MHFSESITRNHSLLAGRYELGSCSEPGGVGLGSIDRAVVCLSLYGPCWRLNTFISNSLGLRGRSIPVLPRGVTIVETVG